MNGQVFLLATVFISLSREDRLEGGEQNMYIALR